MSSDYTTLNTKVTNLETDYTNLYNQYNNLNTSNFVTLNMVRTEIKNYKPIFRKHQLYLDLLGVPLAKQILLDSNKTFGENLKIAILDDGIDLNHPDLEVDETLSNEYNNNNLDMTDTHGTALWNNWI